MAVTTSLSEREGAGDEAVEGPDTAARRRRRSSASPTASSTTGPAPTCSSRRSPRPPGSGSRRQYSYRDLLELRIIKTLLDAGIKLESVRDVFKNLRESVGTDISSANIVISGTSSVVLPTNDELIELMSRGQGVLNILPLAGVKAGVDAGIESCPATTTSTTCTSTPYDARALAARRRPSCARRPDGALRWLGDAARVPTGTIAEHLACRVTPWCSTSRTSARSGSKATPLRHAAAAADQRPRQDRPGPGPVHPPARPRRRLRARRHHRVVASRRRTGRTFDVMPNASNTDRVVAAVGGVETTHERAVLAVQGPRPRNGWRRSGRRPPRSAGSVSPHAEGEGRPCTVAGTGYTGEPGVEIAVPAASRRRCGRPSSPPASAGRPRRPRHAAPRGGPPAARPRARSRHHAVAGRSRLGRRLGKPDFRGRAALAAEQARGLDRHLVGIAIEGRRPPGPNARSSSTARSAASSRPATSRRRSATASPSGSFRRTSRSAPTSRSTCGARCAPASVVETPFVSR